MTNPIPFDEDYYERGIETGKSNYANYRWMPDETIALAIRIGRHLRLNPAIPGTSGTASQVLEIGCAKGFLTHALRTACLVDAKGYDTSEYAITHCHPVVRDYVSSTLEARPMQFDWVIGKDTLEHVPASELRSLITILAASARIGMFFIVPLTHMTGGAYLRDEDEADVTHLIRWTLTDWMDFFHEICPDFDVHGSWGIDGLKPGASQVHKSTGFFTITRSMTKLI